MKIRSRSVNDTKKTSRRIARHLKAGDIICLVGQLGAGKTVFAKGLAEGLGIKEVEVTSPSFVLVRQYMGGRLPMNHIDLYRLQATRQMLDVGYEDYIYGNAVSVIEWAQRLEYLMPSEYLKVEISLDTDEKARRIEVSGVGKRYEELLKELKE